MISVNRRLALAGLVLTAQVPAWSALSGTTDPLDRKSLQTPRALGAVLLGISAAGTRLVAVGERGVVLLSDDRGTTWRKADVPVSTTLTAVRFVDAKLGWAVGHAGVVLHSADAGDSWVRQLDGTTAADLILKAAQTRPTEAAALKNAERLVADGADKPFLDLHFFDSLHGVVVGAYGLAFGTDDGGKTWTPWLDRIDNPKGLHFNALAAQGRTLLLAGEQGQLWSSSDAGVRFTHLASPYAGSWFAAALLASGRWVVAGLKGNAFVSDNQGATFSAAAVPIPVTISSLVTLSDGGLLALNQAGQALLSSDQGKTFRPIELPPGAPITGALQLDGSALVCVTLRGPRSLALPAYSTLTAK